MTATLIVLLVVALGVGVVIWAVRKKPDVHPTGPRETDTAWNDPVTPGEPARPASPPSQDPRP